MAKKKLSSIVIRSWLDYFKDGSDGRHKSDSNYFTLHFHFHIKLPFNELNTFKYTTAGKETLKTENNLKQT